MATKAPKFVRDLHEDLTHDLNQIARHFKAPKLTLVVRSPELADGDIVLTSDDLDKAIASIKHLQKKATFVVEP